MRRVMAALIAALFLTFMGSLSVAETVFSVDLISDGDAAYKKFDNKAALGFFRKAIQLNPSHINHHLELAITYEKMGKKDLAVREYNQVLELPIKDADDEDHKKRPTSGLRRWDNLTSSRL